MFSIYLEYIFGQYLEKVRNQRLPSYMYGHKVLDRVKLAPGVTILTCILYNVTRSARETLSKADLCNMYYLLSRSKYHLLPRIKLRRSKYYFLSHSKYYAVANVIC